VICSFRVSGGIFNGRVILRFEELCSLLPRFSVYAVGFATHVCIRTSDCVGDLSGLALICAGSCLLSLIARSNCLIHFSRNFRIRLWGFNQALNYDSCMYILALAMS
jgi:hypothetical protein